MNPSLASLLYTIGIAGLFYLDRDKAIKTSKALWLPVFYLWIIGSRPLSVWLGIGPPSGTDVQVEGSPIDGAFFQILLVAAICVLIRRGSRVTKFLTVNFPIPVLLYLVFCLFSVIWSDYSLVALKKWIKSVEDLVMILVVVTDPRPIAALRRLFSRMGFILLPYSLLLIKYYPALGRYYGVWDGGVINTGVTLDKNLLGVITFGLSLGAVWRILGILSADEKYDDPRERRRHLWAQGTLLAIGIWLLSLANSATSLVCFVLGTGLMLATKRQFFRRNPAAIHVFVVTLILVAAVAMVLVGRESAAQALGRNANLTGRTDIWAVVIPLVSNPLLGAGFESFWLNPRVHEKLWEAIPGLPLNEAHDGYIEVYLNLGWIGVSLIVLILFDGYRRAVKAFRQDPGIGALLVAFALTAVTYNITEAGFRALHPFWIFYLLAVMEAGNQCSAHGVDALTVPDLSVGKPTPKRAKNALSFKPDRPNPIRKIGRRQPI
jgi:exopolysaccharide production protein ExoQ